MTFWSSLRFWGGFATLSKNSTTTKTQLTKALNTMKTGTLAYEIDKWSNLVGKLILAFGEIELATSKLWEVHFAGKEFPNNFKDRANKLIGKLKAEGAKGINGEDPVNMLISARALADKRNTIAHNPMQTQVFHDRAKDDYHIELAITSDKNDHYIKESDLEILHEEAAIIGRQPFIFITDSVWSKNV